MKTALVHYWLVRIRGGEVVLSELMNIYKDADIYTNVYDPVGVRDMFVGRSPPTTTWINSLPLSEKYYPALVGLMPGALEMLNMDEYDLIVSSESGPAKWVIAGPNTKHICYVHSPMRYLWDKRNEYRVKLPQIARPLFDTFTRYMRSEDVLSSHRVDQFVANSNFVAKRINKYYRREAEVVHPPVNLLDFGAPQSHEDYYLFAGQLVSYKNVKHAVDACLTLGRRLVVVGDGPGAAYVSKFSDRGIDYRGRVSRTDLVDIMGKSRALLFPGIEDFGIIPVEVMAAGRPVIALGAGGALDSVVDHQTGILYRESSSHSLARAILEFEEWEDCFDPFVAVTNAKRFSQENFRRRWAEVAGTH